MNHTILAPTRYIVRGLQKEPLQNTAKLNPLFFFKLYSNRKININSFPTYSTCVYMSLC